MTLWILDTDHVSLLQRDHPIVVQKVAAVNPNDIAVTIVTLVEQMYGRLEVIKRAKSKETVVIAYAQLRQTFDRLCQASILDFDEGAYDRYHELVRQKIRVGTQDLRIAAIALSVNGIVITRNRRDFVQVPDLVIEDWSIA